VKEVRSNGAPSPAGPYSQAVLYGNFIFASGQIGIDPESGELVEGFREQVLRALNNLKAVVEAAGGSRCSIVKVTVYLTELEKFREFNEIYGEFFRNCPVRPARVTVGVKELPLGAQVEVECVAVRG